jgi:hypothetical protein
VPSRQAVVIAFGLAGLLAGAPAFAQGFDIVGVYGNETGCAINRGETVTSDDELLLKPDGFSSMRPPASSCRWFRPRTEPGSSPAFAITRESWEGRCR